MRAVLEPFFALATALRGAGFAVSPDQTQGFIAAVGALGPRGLQDVYNAAVALFAIPPERRVEFDVIFRGIFEGDVFAADAASEDDDETEAYEPSDETIEVEIDQGDETAGEEAAETERLSARAVSASPAEALEEFMRQAPRQLPQRLTYRRKSDTTGDRIDLRRALRHAVRTDGDIFELPRTRRKMRQRRIVCLIDVSGSMHDRSDDLLAFAHALTHSAERVECFTLGTRLTRITTGLRLVSKDAALRRVAEAVADIDGGTRIGEALHAFLSVPRFAGFARSALVIVLSDGLERGTPDLMVEATQKLARVAWRLHWLTPLMADPDYRPETAAMRQIVPVLDALGDASAIPAVCDHVLGLARAA